MTDLFITKIHIDKVRNLADFDIELSANERKHLILTGKNGSGKTSLLEAMRHNFMNIIERSHKGYFDAKSDTSIIPLSGITIYFKNGIFRQIESLILLYIPSHRTLNLNLPRSIKMEERSPNLDMRTNASSSFIDHMVFLNYQKMSAINEGNTAEAERIERWFANFTETLQEIYNCPELELRHESKELNYKIVMPGYEPFGLDQMADGYSAFLKIVMELMVRMEQQNDDLYEAPGIAFVDEIETHLHVELQKKVLPFLTRMFPNIQFIVTTHSPFILTSIDNAVVYDLEKHQRQEDLSAYSYEGVIEYYFDIDMYSNEIRTQFEKYKNLLNNSNRTNEENEELAEIISSLNRIPPAAAEELVYAFRELESKRKQG